MPWARAQGSNASRKRGRRILSVTGRRSRYRIPASEFHGSDDEAPRPKKRRVTKLRYTTAKGFLRRCGQDTPGDDSVDFSAELTFSVSQTQLEKLAESTIGASLVEMTINTRNHATNEQTKPLDFTKMKFLALRRLHLLGQVITKTHFTKENTPKVELLEIREPCNRIADVFYLDLPELKTLHVDSMTMADGAEFALSIGRCAKLETFTSNKLSSLGGNVEHGANCFLMPNAIHVHFSRSNGLRAIKLWAPRLKHVAFLACQDLEFCSVIETVPEYCKETFPGKEYEFDGEQSKYVAHITGTYCVGGNLVTNPRCECVEDTHPDERENEMATRRKALEHLDASLCQANGLAEADEQDSHAHEKDDTAKRAALKQNRLPVNS